MKKAGTPRIIISKKSASLGRGILVPMIFLSSGKTLSSQPSLLRAYNCTKRKSACSLVGNTDRIFLRTSKMFHVGFTLGCANNLTASFKGRMTRMKSKTDLRVRVAAQKIAFHANTLQVVFMGVCTSFVGFPLEE